jgi:hypothetical protein
MDKALIDKLIDRVRQDLYAEYTIDEEPTNAIGDGHGAVKLRPTIMKFDGRTKGTKAFLKKLQSGRQKREERKALKKYPQFKQK